MGRGRGAPLVLATGKTSRALQTLPAVAVLADAVEGDSFSRCLLVMRSRLGPAEARARPHQPRALKAG